MSQRKQVADATTSVAAGRSSRLRSETLVKMLRRVSCSLSATDQEAAGMGFRSRLERGCREAF